MPALWQCLIWLPLAVCSLSLVLLYKDLSVGSRGSSQLLSPYPRRTKAVLLYSLHCFFSTVVSNCSGAHAPHCRRTISTDLSANFTAINSDQRGSHLGSLTFMSPFSLLTLLSFPWPRCGALAELLQIPVDAHCCPKKLATQEKTYLA